MKNTVHQFIWLYWLNPITGRHCCTFANNGHIDNGQNMDNLDDLVDNTSKVRERKRW
jgi:hypothetical protein